MFSCEYCKIFKNSFFIEYLWCVLLYRDIRALSIDFILVSLLVTSQIIQHINLFHATDLFLYPQKTSASDRKPLVFWSGFLMFSGGIGRDQWHKSDWSKISKPFLCVQSRQWRNHNDVLYFILLQSTTDYKQAVKKGRNFAASLLPYIHSVHHSKHYGSAFFTNF